MIRWRLVGVLLALLLLSQPALAHKLKLFAQTEGSWIHGRVYFVGGAAASGAQILVQDDAGQVLAELKPDAAGYFAYRMSAPQSYRLSASTGDGHRDQWTVTATSGTHPNADAASTPSECAANAELERIRFRDVLGGIGYIIGLTGMLLWWRSRQRADRAA